MKIKPLTSGAPIAWRHYYPDGTTVERTGTVWDREPEVDGALVVAWVIPDEPRDDDPYTAIAVGKSTRRDLPVHGEWLGACSGRPQYAAKGELYSSNYFGSPLGRLMTLAEGHAHRVREGVL